MNKYTEKIGNFIGKTFSSQKKVCKIEECFWNNDNINIC